MFLLPSLTFLVLLVSGKKRQPHIVLIVADDLGYNDVPWHNPTIISPHLQDLAREGVILEQNYVQTKCAPSRAALLTGRYPFHIGRQHESLPPQMPTGLSTKYKLLPERLQEVGYRTHAVGKWHLGYCDWAYTPTRRGFETFFGFYTHGTDYYERLNSDSDGGFKGYDLRSNESVTHEGEGEYSANLFSRKAVEVIESHKSGNPMFLYLAFQSIHKPIQVPDSYSRKYQPYGKISKENKRKGMITALDEAVKNVTKALKQSKMYRDTVIIFISDNGGTERNSNWPLRGGKNSVWEGGVRSVAFIHYPRIPVKYAGRSSVDLFHIVDWYPTILAMGGYSTSLADIDGYDQWLSLVGGWPGPRTELVYNINTALRFTAAIRAGKWKIIWGYPEGLRSHVPRKETRAAFAQTLRQARSSDLLYLFNLETDPNETVNLAGENKKVMKILMKKVRRIMKSGKVVKPDTPFLRERSNPKYYGGIVSPGWCKAK